MYVTNTSAVIQYTTADCVIPDNLKIELNIDVDYSNINPSSVVSYESSTTDQFTVLGLEPNAVVTYTLQVIAEVSDNFLNIGMSRTSSFTVISATTSSTTSVSGMNMYVQLMYMTYNNVWGLQAIQRFKLYCLS